MPRYRKKPIVIEAIQYTGQLRELEDFMGDGGEHEGNWVLTEDLDLVIRTLEGNMIANKGDWIIKGVAGEFYPVQPDIFKRLYVEEPT